MLSKIKVYLLLFLVCLLIWVSAVWLGVWGMNKLFIEPWDFQIPQINHIALESLPVEVQIRRIFGEDAEMALAVSQAENGTRNCSRTNKTNDHGVFQIHQTGGYDLDDLHDCTKNIQIAHEIFHKAGGWTPWVAYTNGSYKKYL